jgi:3-hydroxyisobutyrate dehydrogenase
MSKKIGFIGLGVMGYPMAGHLAKAGYDVTIFNRTASVAERWAGEYQGQVAQTPAQAATGAEVVFSCVGNDQDVRAIALGEGGVFAGMGKGAIFVDHTTASADLARELGGIADSAGFGFLDAPVSGGQAGAENAALTIMVGGNEAVYAKAAMVMDVYAKSVRLMGQAGSGQLTKMVNQICIAGIVQGLSEGLHMAEKVGLDVGEVVDVISKGAAQSWQMENRAATMAARKFDYGFAVDWMRKDLGICLNEASQVGARLPLTALVDQFYGDVQARGGGRWDTSSLLVRLEDREDAE